MNNHHATLLLVEDNPSEAKLVEMAFKKCDFCHRMFVAHNGEEAVDFLYKKGKWTRAPRPDIVILDLNLPGMDGHDVLSEIKSDENLKCIPVIMFTSSREKEDVEKLYDLHGNCFITKPVKFERFLEVIKKIQNFWFSVVTLPKWEPQ